MSTELQDLRDEKIARREPGTCASCGGQQEVYLQVVIRELAPANAGSTLASAQRGMCASCALAILNPVKALAKSRIRASRNGA